MQQARLHLLLIGLSLSLCGCHLAPSLDPPRPGTDAGTQPAGVPPRPALLEDFVIGAFNAPPLAETNYSRYREMADCGIDFIVPGNDLLDRPANLQALQASRETGLRVAPVEMTLLQAVHKLDEPLDPALLEDQVRAYRHLPAFAAYTLADEPHRRLFPRLAEAVEHLRKLDPDHPALINLYPSYASTEQMGYPDFRSYVHGYIETVRPDVVCYDHYALTEAQIPPRDWFGDLAVVSGESRAAGLPFWVFIQSEGIHGHLRVPERAEIFWQGATAIAFGARGLHWFCYWTPSIPEALPQVEGKPPLNESHYDAIIDLEGRRTPLYEHAREANRFFRRAGRALLGWDSIAVARYEAGRLVEGESPLLRPAGQDFGLVLGSFARGQGRRVVLANASSSEPARFRLDPLKGYHPGTIIARHGAETDLEGSAGDQGWQLEPGGCLVIELLR